jgi:cell fate (sporulation/competence/biofilm development) regulator YlbF (YheA/YmcA/DUF963 family)
MADINNAGFNPLDSLGPEYGRINRPILDNKGLAPFEGDKLEMPKINFPITPYSDVLESPQRNVREQVVGNPPNKPGASKEKFDFDSYKKGISNKLKAGFESLQDNSTYAKVYSYDAGPDSNAFYKRYAAYGADTFDKIGFSPLRDNEALFNSHTTWWDDHKRMMTNSFWPLFGRGFVAGPKSLGRMLTGDFTGTDIEDARAYKEAAAIGQSSKKGFGAFANNTMMNFGYSAGIMSEAILEEIGGVLLAPETLGGSFFAATANASKNVLKATKGLDVAEDGYKAVNSTLNAIDNVSQARTFWQNANKLGTSAFSPVGSTIKGFQAAKAADNLNNLGKAFKTFGGFYRDVQRINMALSEARLEGGMVKNEVYDKLYNQYYTKNNRPPSDAEQYEMIKQSEKASLNTVLWNTALIYGSNAITFPNIMGSKGGIRSFMKNSLQEFATVKGGKFGDLGKIVYDKGLKKVVFEKNNLKNLAKSWLKQPIYKSTMGTIGYFKANFAEGIQENLQEVISGANERYYVDSFKSPALRSHNYSKAVAKYNEASQTAYFGDELGKQFTATGFETFASGFAMGALATPVNAVFNNLSVGYNRIFDNKAYQEIKDKKEKIVNSLAEQLNSIDVNEFLNARPFNYATQDVVASIKQYGDKKQANDAHLDAFMSQMETMIQTGTVDVFKDRLMDLTQLSPEEFEEAIPTVPKGEGAAYQNKIPDIIKKAKKIEERYKYYNEKFPNPVTYNEMPPKDSPEYEDAAILHNAWNKGIENAIYFNEAFEDTMNRKKSIMETYLSQAPLKGMSQRDSEVIFDIKKLRNEQTILKDEISILKELNDPASQSELQLKERKLEALTKLGDKTATLSNFFNRYERAEEVRKQLQIEKGGEPVTDEEVEKTLDEVFGEYSEENKIKTFSEHEAAYKDYLKALANVNGEYLFDQNIDETYELLGHHFKLDSESRNLMKYVNLLHDPNGFIESVQRNRVWMKDLYKRRSDIYKQMVEEQFNLVIDNTLLNHLADRGIYISLDDFQDWRLTGTPPSEFFDNARKMVIPEGTELYDEYYKEFEKAASLKSQDSSLVPESLNEELKKDLEQADLDMEAELDSIPKKEVKNVIKNLKPDSGKTLSLTKINTELNPNEYAEAEYGGDNPFVIFKDEDGNLRLENIEGEIIKDTSKVAINFSEVTIYTLVERADPELAKPVVEKYEAYKNKIRDEYATKIDNLTKAEEAPINDFVPIVSEVSSVFKYPALYNTLYTSFTDKVISKLDPADLDSLTEEQELNLFNKFLQTDKEAKTEIENFNKKQVTETEVKASPERSDFEYIYQGKKKNTADLKTIADLRKAQRRFKALVDDITSMENPNTEDITNKSKYSVIVKEFDKLIQARSKQNLTPELRTALDKINKLKEAQSEIQVADAGMLIDDEEYQNVETALGLKKNKEPYKVYIDAQIKNLFEGITPPVFDTNAISQEAFDNLFGPKGYITSIKNRVDNGELSVIAQDLAVYDSNTKLATNIDLLLADTQGNLLIVNTINDSKSNWDVFTKKDNPNSKLKDVKLLAVAKANLLNNMIGVDAKTLVLPIEMSVSTANDKIMIANKPTSPSLTAVDALITLDKKDVQDQVNSIIPIAKKETVETKVETENISVVPADAESSDDTQSPAVEAGEQERETRFIDDSVRYGAKEFKESLAKADITTFNAVMAELNLKIQEGVVDVNDLETMSELAKERLEQLKQPQNVKIVPESLTADKQFVAKSIIFTEPGNQKSEIFAEEDDTVVINSVNTKNKTVSVSALGSSKQMTIGFNDINKLFTLKDSIMDATETQDMSLSTEDKIKINESIDLADGFITNPDKLGKVEGESSSKSLEELDNELLNDIDC